jgi:hypothetical protein
MAFMGDADFVAHVGEEEPLLAWVAGWPWPPLQAGCGYFLGRHMVDANGADACALL